MKNLLGIAVLAAMAAGGCSKKEDAGSGGGGAASAAGTAGATATAPPAAAGTAAPAPSAAPPVRADVAAFVAVFDPINARLDHVARARTACEKRRELLDAVNAIDKNLPPAGRQAEGWLAAVEKLQLLVDETGDPCDEGNIKGIESKLDGAKQALDAIIKG